MEVGIVFLLYISNIFTHSGVSIVDFEQVNTGGGITYNWNTIIEEVR